MRYIAGVRNGCYRIRMQDESIARRDQLADAIAGIILEHGLSALTLRTLAARLGTSGRMLIYYFGSKDALVRCALDRVGARMGRLLAEHGAGPPDTPGAILAGIVARATMPDVAPFMRIWTDVVAHGARGESPYDDIASATIGGWLEWIEHRLLENYRGRGMAETILAFMEGVTLLELARPGTTTAARALLPRVLDTMLDGAG